MMLTICIRLFDRDNSIQKYLKKILSQEFFCFRIPLKINKKNTILDFDDSFYILSKFILNSIMKILIVEDT